MKVLVKVNNDFINKNIIENLNNIKTGKNRTRPGLLISEVYDDIEKEVDVAIFFDKDVLSFLENQKNVNTKIVFFSHLSNPDTEIEHTIFDAKQDILVYRVPEIIGKWDQSDSFISNMCRMVSNNVDYTISDPNKCVNLVFIDDLMEELFDALEGYPHRCDYPNAGEQSSDPTAAYDGITPVPHENGQFCYCPVTYNTTISSIVKHLKAFRSLNRTSILPEIPEKSFASKLCSVYLSYLPESEMSYPLNMKVDNRGTFVELVKTANSGQVSINIARPGNVRGEHWHNSKWEIFIVVSGHGLIQEREVGSDVIHSFEVRGEEMRAIIMLPGYTHRIVNLEQDKDLVTVMYANERFDERHPDTFFESVEIS